MPSRSRQFGNWGEKMAESFLLKEGYTILDKNYQKRCGEIDIIADKEGMLHFVEVKTRTTKSIEKFGLPEEAVSRTKQKKIVETALAYLSEHDSVGNIDWQIDVISIIHPGNKEAASINFIENAFDGSYL